jgi:hypothetical protein
MEEDEIESFELSDQNFRKLFIQFLPSKKEVINY